jgi:hypothetical protein
MENHEKHILKSIFLFLAHLTKSHGELLAFAINLHQGSVQCPALAFYILFSSDIIG